MQPLFTPDGAWFGGFYELALEVGARSDDRLRAALAAVWSHPDLDGCYIDRGREYNVILQGREDMRATNTDLTNIRVRSATTKELVPLASIVKI